MAVEALGSRSNFSAWRCHDNSWRWHEPFVGEVVAHF